MLAAFNVTAMSAFGYDFGATQQFANPYDPRFSAQIYNASAFTPEAVKKAVLALAALEAYSPAMALMSAEAAYYSTAGYNGDAYTVAQSTTVSPVSSGYGFASTTATSGLSVTPSVSATHKHGPRDSEAVPTAHPVAFQA